MTLNGKGNFYLPMSGNIRPYKMNKIQMLLKKKPMNYRHQYKITNTLREGERELLHFPETTPKEKFLLEYLYTTERYKNPSGFTLPVQDSKDKAKSNKKFIANLKELIQNNSSKDSKIRKPKSYRTAIKEQNKKLPKIKSIEEPQLKMIELLIKRINLGTSQHTNNNPEKSTKITSRQQHKVKYIINKGNNSELVKKVLAEREWWIESTCAEFNFKWKPSSFGIQFSRLGSLGVLQVI